MRDDDARPDGMVERLAWTRPWTRPVSYAPVLTRLARGEPALTVERRSRPRLPAGPRGRLVDLLG